MCVCVCVFVALSCELILIITEISLELIRIHSRGVQCVYGTCIDARWDVVLSASFMFVMILLLLMASVFVGYNFLKLKRKKHLQCHASLSFVSSSFSLSQNIARCLLLQPVQYVEIENKVTFQLNFNK